MLHQPLMSNTCFLGAQRVALHRGNPTHYNLTHEYLVRRSWDQKQTQFYVFFKVYAYPSSNAGVRAGYGVFTYVYYMYMDIVLPIWTGCASVLASTEPLEGVPVNEDPRATHFLSLFISATHVR